MKKIIIIIALFLCSYTVFSQDAKDLVQIHATADNTSMNAITSPEEGALVYNQSDNKLYIYNGSLSSWEKIVASNTGDVKNSFKNSDHSGWYLLDGRTIASLPTNAQAVATSLGFAGNIPNADNRVLKHPTGAESVGDIGGQTTTTLVQANLPNVNFTGGTNNTGNHNHNLGGTFSNQNIRYPFDDVRTVLLSGGATATSTTGNHTHTVSVSSGGSSQPVERYQPYLVTNVFIFLGI